jgi:soluble epoxide hydrolase / lipid-phosphate phosphatase
MWHPEFFICVFVLAVHYTSPNREFVSLDTLVKLLPTLKYQQQLAGPDLEAAVDSSEQNLRGFLNAIYHGDGPVRSADETWSNQGMDLTKLDKVGPSPMMSNEMMDHYVQEFGRHGIHYPLQWYRTRKFNYEDELVFTRQNKPHTFKMPCMLVMARHDIALPPSLAHKQSKYFEDGFVQHTIDSSHWLMIEKPEETNKLIGQFIRGVLQGQNVKGKL